jgi:hypothetical protein
MNHLEESEGPKNNCINASSKSVDKCVIKTVDKKTTENKHQDSKLVYVVLYYTSIPTDAEVQPSNLLSRCSTCIARHVCPNEPPNFKTL